MSESIAVQLVSFLLLGVAAQWLGWRLKLPAILLLLFAGFLVGPAMQAFGQPKLLDPGRVFGDLLLPVVSLSVAIVLFEGGMSLNFHELKHAGRVILNLVTLGAAITWVVATVAAHLVLRMAWPLASLLGAILIVTGPTVIGPLLRHVRPIGRSGPILRWEGIVIDPIGAIFTVLVFEAIPKGSVSLQEATVGIFLGLGRIVLVGGLIGTLVARWIITAFQRFWVPDYLQNAVTLAAVVAAFTGANLIAHESGLLAVTMMGILLGNQQRVSLSHISEFKENLAVLLVASLFVVLASRLSIEQVAATGPAAISYTAILILVARPLAVLLSTIRSELSWRERVFLAWMAPRGIVAASVASLFALRLDQLNYPGGEELVPVTFTVIVGTVSIYGLTSSRLSRRLQLSLAMPGFLIAGANPVARAIGAALQTENQTVLLVDTSFEQIRDGRLSGLPVLFGSVLSQYVQRQIELTGIARLLALTPNEEANSLAALRFLRVFGRENVFQLAPDGGEYGRKQKVAPEQQGRALFGAGVTYEALAERLETGDVIKCTRFSDTFRIVDFRAMHGEHALALFVRDEHGQIEPICEGQAIDPKPGHVLLSLVTPSAAPVEAAPAPKA